MVNLQLTDEHVYPERDVILEERRSRVDNEPSSLLGEQLDAGAVSASPLPAAGDRLAARDRELSPRGRGRASIGAGTRPTTRSWSSPATSRPPSCGRWPRRPMAASQRAPMPPARRRAEEPPQHAERRIEPRRSAGAAAEPDPLLPGAELRLAGQGACLRRWTVLAEILGGGGTSRLYRKLVVEQALGDRRRLPLSGGGARSDHAAFLSEPRARRRPGRRRRRRSTPSSSACWRDGVERGRGRAHAAAHAGRGDLCPRLR